MGLQSAYDAVELGEPSGRAAESIPHNQFKMRDSLKSPFPGMDPFIESCELWEDFHDDLIMEIKQALAPLLPPGYLARTRKRCYVVLTEAEGKRKRTFVPEVSVAGRHQPC